MGDSRKLWRSEVQMLEMATNHASTLFGKIPANDPVDICSGRSSRPGRELPGYLSECYYDGARQICRGVFDLC